MSEEKPISSASLGGVQLVHSISGFTMDKLGFILIGKGKYWREKDGAVVTYDGYQWKYGDTPIQFIEDLEKLLEK